MTKFNLYLNNELGKIPFNLFNILSSYTESNKKVKVAFVGGYVRDLLISNIHQTSSFSPVDLDIIIEGSAIDLAIFIKKNISNVNLCLIKEFDIYKTVELSINNLKIDIASAREETYISPGLNPKVSESTIIEDLKRRDFSINSIAYEISKKKIYDLFDGVKHIRSKEIHLLHENSISDDPSRLLRCAKYASRLGFEISELSLNQAQNTVSRWPWKDKVNNNYFPPGVGIRMRMELAEILKYDDISKIISKLYEWKVISIINKNIEVNNKFLRGLKWIKKIDGNIILYLLKDSESLELLSQRLFVNKKDKKILNEYLYITEIINSDINNFLDFSPSKWTEFIEENNLDKETIKLLISDGGIFWKPLFRWLFKYRFIKSSKNGDQLKREGWIQGKEIGIEIKRLRYIEIDKHS